jgi:hypothetical protein
MSVRTEPRDVSAQLHQALTIPQDALAAAAGVAPMVADTGAMVPGDQALHAANDFNTTSPDHPLKRTVVINIRASLSDLCLKANRATWAPPSADATKAIFQQAHPPARPAVPWARPPAPPPSPPSPQVARARAPAAADSNPPFKTHHCYCH